MPRREKIFISYRREDTRWVAVNMDSNLSDAFGPEAVFLDVRDIEPGQVFPDELKRQLASADILLAVIGKTWLSAQDEFHRRRIDSAKDWVRIEIESALQNPRCLVIPVLVDEANLPEADALPTEIVGLSQRQALRIRQSDVDADIRTLIGHLRASGLQPLPEAEVSPDATLWRGGHFDPPKFDNAQRRSAALAAIRKEMDRYPVITIGGLSGAGKTYLMAEYLSTYRDTHFRDALWYDTSEGDTLDSLVAHFALARTLTGLATTSRCKEILSILASEKKLLIIDDFQQVNQESYAQLIELAMRSGSPCRLVLLSQTRVESLGATEDPHHIEISGYQESEIEALLLKQAIPDAKQLAAQLAEKTGGLPFAVSMFCNLVRDVDRDPQELLEGEMPRQKRVKGWFDRIERQLDDEARALLPCLSLTDGPFNGGVARMLGKYAGISYFDESFAQLQRAFLVTRYSPYRWKVHDLVGYLSQAKTDQLVIADVHKVLGHHFSRTPTKRSSEPLSETAFLDLVKGFRHLNKSNEGQAKVEALLLQLSPTAKARGHYELFSKLVQDYLAKTRSANPWLTYHHAHCLLILGRTSDCLKLVEPKLYTESITSNDKLRLVFTRLYAEALGSSKQLNEAISSLKTALATTPGKMAEETWYVQAESTLIWLLTRLGMLDEANSMCDAHLAKALASKDIRHTAVAMARKGMILSRRQAPREARDFLHSAADLFREFDDKRGIAWTLGAEAGCALNQGNELDALELFREAVRISDQIGECGADHQELVAQFAAEASSPELRALAAGEQRRIGGRV